MNHKEVSTYSIVMYNIRIFITGMFPIYYLILCTVKTNYKLTKNHTNYY